MFSLSHVFAGLVMVGGGICFVKYTFKLVNITGRQDWIERYAGSGSTYGVYKLFGVLLVIVGILFMTGFGGNVLDFFFSPLRNVFQPLKNG
jgi:hypothetical protein